MSQLTLRANLSLYKFDLYVKYRTLLLFFLASALFDALSTTYFMTHTGPGLETNFYVRTLSYHYGIIVGPVIGKLYQLFALWGFSVITPRLTAMICTTVIGVNLSAAVINFTRFTL